MAKLRATIELSMEYGHCSNRPSTSTELKRITEALNEILEKAATQGMYKNKLANWYLTAIKVE